MDDLQEVHLTALEGLGSSYRMKGFFTLKDATRGEIRISFEGVAFGGNYGGHNVNVNISPEDRERLIREQVCNDGELEELLSEVQRKLLNNEMIVEYENIKPEEHSDGLGI